MSDQQQQAATAAAIDPRRSAAAAAAPEQDDNLLHIGDLIFGMKDDGTFDQEADVRFAVDPHGQSRRDGSAKAVFRAPGNSTVSTYNNQRFGLKGNRANEWKAAEAVLLSRFRDLEGVAMTEPLRAKYGTWQGFLTKCSGARDFAKNLASSYIDEVKARTGARTVDGDDE